MRVTIPCIVLVLLLTTVALRAQGGWTQVFPSTSPGARSDHAMAYDPVRQRIVLFGGSTAGSTRLNDTWEWDGSTWTQAHPASSPSARSAHAMAWDPVNRRVILFGGVVLDWIGLADTWEWDGSSWIQMSPATVPPSRFAHALATDMARNRVVLFGGSHGPTALGDTWEWDGSSWLQRAAGPAARTGMALAYDVSRGRVVLFGGYAFGPLGDTWDWDGAGWVMRSPSLTSPPPRRYDHVLSYDAALQEVVLFGGSGSGLNDTWELDGATWSQIQGVAPPPRSSAAAVYDPGPSATVLFGGYDSLQATTYSDTWTYRAIGGHQAVFPAVAAAAEGNTALGIPFAVAQSRIQVLMEPAGFASKRAGMIKGIAFRRDQGLQSHAARAIDLQILIGFAKTRAATMSTQFLSNWQGTPTTVFSRSGYYLPPQPPVSNGPAPFDLQLPFMSSVVWNGETLLYEIATANSSMGGAYELDAQAELPQASTVQPFGAACMGSTATPQYVYPDPLQVMPGGTITGGLASALPGALAFQFLGASTSSWQGIPLPYVWPGTTCTFYTDWLIAQSRPISTLGTAQVSWPLPNDPQWIGAALYGQWAILEGAPLLPPIVLTDAVKLVVGGAHPAPYNAIANLDGSATGSKLQPGGFITLVTQVLFQ